jgi:hypothetical protein
VAEAANQSREAPRLCAPNQGVTNIPPPIAWTPGNIDSLKIRPLAHMGYLDYTLMMNLFEIKPEGLGGERLSKGLQGLPRKRW